MPVLDLSDNTLLAVEGASVEIQDPRDVHLSNDCRLFFEPVGEEEGFPRFRGVLCRILAGHRAADGSFITVARASLDYPHAAYGRKVLQGTAFYRDNAQEDWRIRVDPLTMRFEWVRQPDNPAEQLCFKILVPSQHNTPELWQTGQGFQVASSGPVAPFGRPDSLDSDDEAELFFYSVHPKNCFRLELSLGGDIRFARSNLSREPLPGEPESARDRSGLVCEPVWEVTWTARPGAMVFLNGTWGVTAAANDFAGRRPCIASDATHDFGSFYSQVYLACLPLNIAKAEPGRVRARSSVLSRASEPVETRPREVAWACEFLYLVDPATARAMLKDQLDQFINERTASDPDWPAGHLRDDTIAELLMMAGRMHALDGDTDYLNQRLAALRRCAEHLLDLRLPEEALPLTASTWDAQGLLIGKEPYLTALCFAGLNRLAFMEEALENHSYAARWRREAAMLQQAAMSSHQYGGLWHAERGVFINHLDYRTPETLSPRRENWTKSPRVETGRPWCDFALYQNVVPFWLGLVDDPQLVETAYEWIDSHFTYARGRGGPKYPPYMCDTFITLLDVCVRMKYGVAGAETLLHAILEHAFDAGIPFTRAPFGGQVAVSPNDFAELLPAERRLPAGCLLDNSPYFGLILNLHYGLDYSKRGWHLGMPRPLANYPLTRVTNLRHEHATYAVTWRDRGKVKRIFVDGKPHRSSWLELTEGRHEVVVELG